MILNRHSQALHSLTSALINPCLLSNLHLGFRGHVMTSLSRMVGRTRTEEGHPIRREARGALHHFKALEHVAQARAGREGARRDSQAAPARLRRRPPMWVFLGLSKSRALTLLPLRPPLRPQHPNRGDSQ